MMNLTHVLAFQRVAAAGSFTTAAQLAGVSQPTLSSQVRALEAVMGTPLFARDGRRIRLTNAGEHLHEATARLAIAIEEVERIVHGARRETRGSLRISADSAIHVLPVLSRLKARSPAFRFSLRISNSAEVIAEVLRGTADIGVTARWTEDPRLHTLRIRDDRLVVMLEANDPLARRRRVSVAALAGRDVVVRERGSITREAAENVLTYHRVRTGSVFDVATREAVREAVAAGFGYGIVFASEAGTDPRLRSVAIDDADVRVAEFVICRTDRRELGPIARFFDAAGEFARSSGWLGSREAGAKGAVNKVSRMR
jgi:DNA-binding transcriptional LysR family regulator